MFDIGFSELVLIFIVALVVLGPQRLPLVVRGVASFIRTARQMANGVQVELTRELKMHERQPAHSVKGADYASRTEPVDSCECRAQGSCQTTADQTSSSASDDKAR